MQLSERFRAFAARVSHAAGRMSNGPELLEAMFACWKQGLVAVPVNARLLAPEVAFHARDCGAVALLHGAEHSDGAAEIDVPHRVVVRGDGPLPYGKVLKRELRQRFGE